MEEKPLVRLIYDVHEPISVYVVYWRKPDGIVIRYVHFYETLYCVFQILHDYEKREYKWEMVAIGNNKEEMYRNMVEAVRKEIKTQWEKRKQDISIIHVICNDLELYGLLKEVSDWKIYP
ncbi:MAG: hypothetical protein QW794_00380 [Thermosphaera sp.]